MTTATFWRAGTTHRWLVLAGCLIGVAGFVVWRATRNPIAEHSKNLGEALRLMDYGRAYDLMTKYERQETAISRDQFVACMNQVVAPKMKQVVSYSRGESVVAGEPHLAMGYIYDATLSDGKSVPIGVNSAYSVEEPVATVTRLLLTSAWVIDAEIERGDRPVPKYYISYASRRGILLDRAIMESYGLKGIYNPIDRKLRTWDQLLAKFDKRLAAE